MSHLSKFGMGIVLFALLFSGILPLTLAVIATINTGYTDFLFSACISIAVIGTGILVLLKGSRYYIPFGLIVAIHYYGVIISNYWNLEDLLDSGQNESRIYARMIRSAIFGTTYLFYFCVIKLKTHSNVNGNANANIRT